MDQRRLRGRYLRIVMFFIGAFARFIGWEVILARIGFRSLTRRTRRERFRREAIRFRALAIRMGGVMIKVGQFLSSRLDVLPPEITDELANLQDEVPPESFADIRVLAERELGKPLTEAFEWVDENPLAAASLGQVHRARLRAEEDADFYEVVIKVQRPYIESIVDVDLAALRRVGAWLMHYRPIREHADVPALVREFSTIVMEEIDYVHEAGNARTFLENFKADRKVRVPRVVDSHSTKRVLTLEDVYAIKITDYEAIRAAGIDPAQVARKLFDVYLVQIFEDGFFHADPHPGNLFVTPLPPKAGAKSRAPRWQLTFVDFGMVGKLSEGLRSGLREAVIALGTRDAARLIRSYHTLGFLLPNADAQALEQTSAMIFDRFWGMSMSELRKVRPSEVRDIGHRVRDVMLEMPFQVPNDLLILVRTLGILSGMCTGLDPNFNLWEQLSPYARKLVEGETDSGLDAILDQLGEMVKVLAAIPAQTSRVLAQMEQGNLTVQSPAIARQIRLLEHAVNRLTAGLIFAALLLGGVMLFTAGKGVYANIFFVSAVIVLVWVLFFGRRR